MGGGPQVTFRRVVWPGLEIKVANARREAPRLGFPSLTLGVARAGGSCDTRSVVGPASSIEFRLIRLVPFLAHGRLACEDRRSTAPERNTARTRVRKPASRCPFRHRRARRIQSRQTAPDHQRMAIEAMTRARTPAASGRASRTTIFAKSHGRCGIEMIRTSSRPADDRTFSVPPIRVPDACRPPRGRRLTP
jgi:hypothetical protein